MKKQVLWPLFTALAAVAELAAAGLAVLLTASAFGPPGLDTIRSLALTAL